MDPDQLTDDDIKAMIEHLRANRTFFKQEKATRSRTAVIPTGTVDEMLEILDLKGKKL